MSSSEGPADLRLLLFKECHYKKPFGHSHVRWQVINQPGVPITVKDLDGYGFLVPEDAPQDVVDHVQQLLSTGSLFGDQFDSKWVLRGLLRDSDVRKLRSSSSDTRYEDVVVAKSSTSDAMTFLNFSSAELPKKTALPPPPKYDK